MRQDWIKRSWVNINLDHLRHNYRLLCGHVPGTSRVMGVIKANAYGHGYHAVARELVEAGCAWLAVSNIEEAMSLREAGIGCSILIFTCTPPQYAARLAELDLVQTVFSAPYAADLQRAAVRAGVRLRVHIKIDTGMARIGFSPDRDEEIAAACACPNFLVEGAFTHFAIADEPQPEAAEYTRRQYRVFCSVLGRLEERGIRFPLRHCCNSAGVLRFPEMAMELVRPGIALYGYSPSAGCDGVLPLRPVMEWRAAVTMVKDVPEGTAISYGRTFVAPRPMRVATLPVGYADGYGREQSNQSWVLIRGRRAPVVGRVCMDQIMVDVSGIEGVEAGDEALVAGGGAPGFDELAARAGTISYEKLCAVGERIPRVFLKNGACVSVANYMP